MTSVKATRALAAYLYDEYENPRKDYFFIPLAYDITGKLHKWLSNL